MSIRGWCLCSDDYHPEFTRLSLRRPPVHGIVEKPINLNDGIGGVNGNRRSMTKHMGRAQPLSKTDASMFGALASCWLSSSYGAYHNAGEEPALILVHKLDILRNPSLHEKHRGDCRPWV